MLKFSNIVFSKVFRSGGKNLKIYSKSDRGLVRESNQDCHKSMILSSDTVWSVVCDGMGGKKGGDIASCLAVEKVSEFIEGYYAQDMGNEEIKKLLEDAVLNANDAIYEESLKMPEYSGMGTTVVLAFINKNDLHIVYAGDSRAYLVNGLEVKQITTDHSIVQEMINTGEITEEQAASHPQKNIITRALGVDRNTKIDYIKTEFLKNDCLLLCTDGFSNYFDADMIRKFFSEFEIDKLADEFISKVKDLGGKDNITVVLISND